MEEVMFNTEMIWAMRRYSRHYETVFKAVLRVMVSTRYGQGGLMVVGIPTPL